MTDDAEPAGPDLTPDGIAARAGNSDRKPLIVAGLIFVAIIGVLTFTRDDDDSSTASSDRPAASSTVEVIYNVGGSARTVDITIETPTGTSQQQSVAVPIRNKSGTTGLRMQMPRGAFVYISAQNNGGGTVTCSIVSDGITISENTSSGEYAIATCDGRA